MAKLGRWRMMRRAALGIVLASAGLAGAASIALAADRGVAISGFSFSPRDVTVSVGDSVTWTNSDAQAHTATADDGSFDTDSIGNGASKSVTFSTAGTFAYHCEIHPTMTGTVVVEAASSGGGGGGGATARPTTPATDSGVEPAGRSEPERLAAILVMLTGGAAGFAIAARRARRA